MKSDYINRYYKGPFQHKETATLILKGLGVPFQNAVVYTNSYDTGYPGLHIESTTVELETKDKDLVKRVDEALLKLNFKPRGK